MYPSKEQIETLQARVKELESERESMVRSEKDNLRMCLDERKRVKELEVELEEVESKFQTMIRARNNMSKDLNGQDKEIDTLRVRVKELEVSEQKLKAIEVLFLSGDEQ